MGAMIAWLPVEQYACAEEAWAQESTGGALAPPVKDRSRELGLAGAAGGAAGRFREKCPRKTSPSKRVLGKKVSSDVAAPFPSPKRERAATVIS